MKRSSGFTLVELVVSVGIFGMIILVVSTLQITIFTQSKLSQGRNAVNQQSLIALHNFASEVRAAETPYDGSFPIASATGSTVSFYADVNGNGIIERIRYSVENGELRRGIIIPTGQPLSYDPLSEKVATIISNVLNTPPYFTYYGSSYDGSTSTPALAQPVSTSNVRLVQMQLQIDPHVRGQSVRTLETSAMVRSLKNK